MKWLIKCESGAAAHVQLQITPDTCNHCTSHKFLPPLRKLPGLGSRHMGPLWGCSSREVLRGGGAWQERARPPSRPVHPPGEPTRTPQGGHQSQLQTRPFLRVA
jgi:hypothetical protein